MLECARVGAMRIATRIRVLTGACALNLDAGPESRTRTCPIVSRDAPLGRVRGRSGGRGGCGAMEQRGVIRLIKRLSAADGTACKCAELVRDVVRPVSF